MVQTQFLHLLIFCWLSHSHQNLFPMWLSVSIFFWWIHIVMECWKNPMDIKKSKSKGLPMLIIFEHIIIGPLMPDQSEYHWVSVTIPECTWVHMNVFEQYWMQLNMIKCNWMHMHAIECNWVHVNAFRWVWTIYNNQQQVEVYSKTIFQWSCPQLWCICIMFRTLSYFWW